MQSEIFDVTLCNRIEGRGQHQLLGKTASHFFHFYLFKPPPCPPSLPARPASPSSFLINHNFSWKSKLKHTSVDITCFSEGANFSLTNHKKYLLETFHRTSETSKLELFTKKLTAYIRKQFLQKVLA